MKLVIILCLFGSACVVTPASGPPPVTPAPVQTPATNGPAAAPTDKAVSEPTADPDAPRNRPEALTNMSRAWYAALHTGDIEAAVKLSLVPFNMGGVWVTSENDLRAAYTELAAKLSSGPEEPMAATMLSHPGAELKFDTRYDAVNVLIAEGMAVELFLGDDGTGKDRIFGLIDRSAK